MENNCEYSGLPSVKSYDSQTPVEWLAEQILKPENLNAIRLGGKKDLLDLIKQAKAMEIDTYVKYRAVIYQRLKDVK